MNPEIDSLQSYVTFGTYPQTLRGKDNTPIEWFVLDVKDGKALLLSRYGLDIELYGGGDLNTWETSYVRRSLNTIFLKRAFTSTEQEKILLSHVPNDKSQGFPEWDSDGGNDTQDKVFLLSYAEANKYFGVTMEDTPNPKAQLTPTACTFDKHTFQPGDFTAVDGRITILWWLRSPGRDQNHAAYITSTGSLSYDDAGSDFKCIRPALWIKLSFLAELKEKASNNIKGRNAVIHAAISVEKCSVGKIATFGTYPQTKKGNDCTPIEWLVLDVKGEKALLLSRFCLDTQLYNTKFGRVKWEECSLRKWLNEDFLNRAFSLEEQKRIILTHVPNDKSQGFSKCEMDSGNDTLDKVFLLSCAETKKHIAVIMNDGGNVAARTLQTDYALSQSEFPDDIWAPWWLRSPGYEWHTVAQVRMNRSIYCDHFDLKWPSIRPALWVKFSPEVF